MSRDMKNILSNCSWRDVNKKKNHGPPKSYKKKKIFFNIKPVDPQFSWS